MAVERSMEIHSVHLAGKPMNVRSYMRNSQETESNALTMSIFKRTAGQWRLYSHRQASCTAMKLSWIDLPRMKALWLFLISAERCGASRVASALATSFPTLCIKLMGR